MMGTVLFEIKSLDALNKPSSKSCFGNRRLFLRVCEGQEELVSFAKRFSSM